MVIETWASDDPSNMTDGFAHFRLVTGYDDARQVWIVYDSYIARNLVNPQGAYQGMYVTYAQADQLWRVMNRKYVVVYTTAQAPLVQAIVGSNCMMKRCGRGRWPKPKPSKRNSQTMPLLGLIMAAVSMAPIAPAKRRAPSFRRPRLAYPCACFGINMSRLRPIMPPASTPNSCNSCRSRTRRGHRP